MSGEVVLMTLVGGMGTFYGPVVGALIVVSMQNYLAQFGEWVTVIQGVVFVACVLVFRRGIVGELAARAVLADVCSADRGDSDNNICIDIAIGDSPKKYTDWSGPC